MSLKSLITNSSLYSETKKIVLYRGVKNPDIIFIGEAPGFEENREGKPFVGRCGKLLDKWIASTGLSGRIGIVNTVPLLPLTESGKIRKPTPSEIEYFSPVLTQLLKKFKPKVLILLGDIASQAVLKKPIRETKIKIFKKGDYIITGNYHPSYYLRTGMEGLDDFSLTIKRVEKWIKK